MNMKTRLLIRHAQSAANRGDATAGDVDGIPLSGQGRQDAAGFASAWVLAGAPDVLVCSQQLRSQQTGQIIQERHWPCVPIETWADVQEFHFLDFGSRWTTPAERRPLVERYFAAGDPSIRHPGAESWADLYARCAALDHKLATHPAGRLLLVGHGYFLMALLTLRELGFPPVSPALMRLVHARQLGNPVRNLQAFELVYPPAGPA